jgi:hypothetical protein
MTNDIGRADTRKNCPPESFDPKKACTNQPLLDCANPSGPRKYYNCMTAKSVHTHGTTRTRRVDRNNIPTAPRTWPTSSQSSVSIDDHPGRTQALPVRRPVSQATTMVSVRGNAGRAKSGRDNQEPAESSLQREPARSDSPRRLQDNSASYQSSRREWACRPFRKGNLRSGAVSYSQDGGSSSNSE